MSVAAKTWSGAALGAMVLLTAGYSLPRGSSTEPDEYNVDASYAFVESVQSPEAFNQSQTLEGDDSLAFRWGAVTIADAPRLPKFVHVTVELSGGDWNGYLHMVDMDQWQVAAFSYDTCEGVDGEVKGKVESTHFAQWYDPYEEATPRELCERFNCSGQQTR